MILYDDIFSLKENKAHVSNSQKPWSGGGRRVEEEESVRARKSRAVRTK
jgi:hypothetical protein